MKSISEKLYVLADTAEDKVLQKNLYILAGEIDKEIEQIYAERGNVADEMFQGAMDLMAKKMHQQGEGFRARTEAVKNDWVVKLVASPLWSGTYAEAKSLFADE